MQRNAITIAIMSRRTEQLQEQGREESAEENKSAWSEKRELTAIESRDGGALPWEVGGELAVLPLVALEDVAHGDAMG